MSNTGLLMRVNGESTYGLIRRFLIANYGAHINIPEEVNSNYRYYKIFYTAFFYDEKFIEKYNLKTQSKLFDVSLPSRPKKCCPSCMSVGFHTYLFEHRWLNKCLIHEDDIVTHCPICRQPWMSYSELLASNYCSCCGIRMNFQSLFKNQLIDREKLNIYGFIQEIFQRRELDLGFEKRMKMQLESSNIWYLDIYQLMFDQSISGSSLLNLSIMNSESSITQVELAQLGKAKIPFVETTRYSYKLPEKKPFNTSSDNGKGLKDRLSDLDNIYIDLIAKQTIKKEVSEIRENEYVLKEGVLSSYTPYFILTILLEKQITFEYFGSINKSIPYMFLFDFNFEYLKRAHHFIGDLYKSLIGDYLKYPYCQLPRELIYKLYTAELWKLCYYSIHIVDDFSVKNNGNDVVKWNELDDLIDQIVMASMSSDYTLSVSMTSKKMNVIFPNFLLVQSLDINAEEEKLVMMNDGAEIKNFN